MKLDHEQPTKEINLFDVMRPKLAKFHLDDIKSHPLACREDEIPGSSGPFGLCIHNPVPVHGIPSSEIYLSRLRTANGERLKWERKGSSFDSRSEKPIDCYQLFDTGGNPVTKVYISPYHWRTSLKPVEGFELEW